MREGRPFGLTLAAAVCGLPRETCKEYSPRARLRPTLRKCEPVTLVTKLREASQACSALAVWAGGKEAIEQPAAQRKRVLSGSPSTRWSQVGRSTWPRAACHIRGVVAPRLGPRAVRPNARAGEGRRPSSCPLRSTRRRRGVVGRRTAWTSPANLARASSGAPTGCSARSPGPPPEGR